MRKNDVRKQPPQDTYKIYYRTVRCTNVRPYMLN